MKHKDGEGGGQEMTQTGNTQAPCLRLEAERRTGPGGQVRSEQGKWDVFFKVKSDFICSAVS